MKTRILIPLFALAFALGAGQKADEDKNNDKTKTAAKAVADKGATPVATPGASRPDEEKGHDCAGHAEGKGEGKSQSSSARSGDRHGGDPADLTETISAFQWCMALPRLLLKTNSKFANCLRMALTTTGRAAFSVPTELFLLPLPYRLFTSKRTSCSPAASIPGRATAPPSNHSSTPSHRASREYTAG